MNTPGNPPREFPEDGPWTWGAPSDTIIYGWTPGAPPPDLTAAPGEASAPPPAPAPVYTEPLSSPQRPAWESAPQPAQHHSAAEGQAGWEAPLAYDEELPAPLGPAQTPEERFYHLQERRARHEG